MSLATGIDITAIDRFIGKSVDAAFLERLLTDTERRECLALPNIDRQVAMRFAAKEAVMKALGTGWDKGVGWHDIEILRDSAALGVGCATLRVGLCGKARELAGNRSVLLSVSHTGAFAAAFVTMESC
ncbi:MAG: holo-[acyl-carrier-protein] synthase [Deltaproteobacteria bacterium RIFCSPLOWO2_02_FULL_53_8]|nr:MAG: holo-[acyl-carrier-protein] synthase [Deltaproteobacteria bacterium RIFCSPLOWO2_02_FULL_53_8]